jgi:hypothetical protein
MDIADINLAEAAENGATVHLEHPATGEKLYVPKGKTQKPMTITLLGMDSAKYKRAVDKFRQKAGRKAKALTTQQLEARGAQLLASVTTGWTEIVFRGEELPFSVDNALLLYTESTWVREQVDEFVHERENFMKTA